MTETFIFLIILNNNYIYTKKVYDLLKNFETDFDVKNSISGETLEEYFRSLLPSQLYFTSRVKLK